MKSIPAIFALLTLGACCLLAQDPTPKPLSSAIHVRRAITVSGAIIDDAMILVENGRITAIGKAGEVKLPVDVDVLEAVDQVATPGFIHPASVAFLTNATNLESAGKASNADRSIADELRPSWDGVKAVARAGFTRLNVVPSEGGFAGQGVLVRPLAKNERPLRPEMIIVQRNTSLMMGFEPRTTVKAHFRDVLGKAKKYRDERDAAASKKPTTDAKAPADSKPVEGAESKPSGGDKPASRPTEPVKDPKLLPIVASIEGKLPGFLNVASPAAILHLMQIKKDFPEWNPVLVLPPDAWRVMTEIKAMNTPVIFTTAHTVRPDTEIEVATQREFIDAGVPVAIIPENSFISGYVGFVFHLGELVRHGVSAADALRAVTLTPAEMLGIQDEVGSLQKGRAADLLLWSGEPFEPSARITRVVIGGETILDETKEP